MRWPGAGNWVFFVSLELAGGNRSYSPLMIASLFLFFVGLCYCLWVDFQHIRCECFLSVCLCKPPPLLGKIYNENKSSTNSQKAHHVLRFSFIDLFISHLLFSTHHPQIRTHGGACSPSQERKSSTQPRPLTPIYPSPGHRNTRQHPLCPLHAPISLTRTPTTMARAQRSRHPHHLSRPARKPCPLPWPHTKSRWNPAILKPWSCFWGAFLMPRLPIARFCAH